MGRGGGGASGGGAGCGDTKKFLGQIANKICTISTTNSETLADPNFGASNCLIKLSENYNCNNRTGKGQQVVCTYVVPDERARVCVCVCVREREREKREQFMCVCVRVSVCASVSLCHGSVAGSCTSYLNCTGKTEVRWG